ncbi:MAG: DUF4386 family protein [Steroidobacteraceae bacterium]
MTTRIANASPRAGARITGAVYLICFFAAILAEFFLIGLVKSGDAAATTNNILAHEPLCRLGLSTGLVSPHNLGSGILGGRIGVPPAAADGREWSTMEATGRRDL